MLGFIIKCFFVVVAKTNKTTVAHVEEELEHVLLATLLSGDRVMLQKVLHTLHYRQPTLREFIEMSLKYIRSAEQVG